MHKDKIILFIPFEVIEYSKSINKDSTNLTNEILSNTIKEILIEFGFNIPKLNKDVELWYADRIATTMLYSQPVILDALEKFRKRINSHLVDVKINRRYSGIHNYEDYLIEIYTKKKEQ